jgi:outer membrane protein
MKNGLLIWNAVLTLLTGFLLFKQLGGNKKNTGGTVVKTTDISVTNKPVSIAYFEMDSVASQFEMVKTLKADLSKKENGMQNELDRLTKAIQQRYLFFQNQEKEGKLTPETAQNAGVEIKKMEDDLKMKRAQMEQEYSDFMAKRQADIKTKIEDYIKEYNQQTKFTYVLSDDPGLFYYRDTTLNITNEVIKGLNSRYKAAAK